MWEPIIEGECNWHLNWYTEQDQLPCYRLRRFDLRIFDERITSIERGRWEPYDTGDDTLILVRLDNSLFSVYRVNRVGGPLRYVCVLPQVGDGTPCLC